MALERLQKKFTRMLLQIMGIGSEDFFFSLESRRFRGDLLKDIRL